MRLFVALAVAPNIRDAITSVTKDLEVASDGTRWSSPDAMHVTLKFLGQTDAQQLEPLRAALATIVLSAPVSLRYRGVGFFPDDRSPRVMWCGVEAPPNLFELSLSIERFTTSLDFEPESRRYVPHVTLARLNSARNVEKLVRAAAPLKSYDFGSARESEFHLFESVLKKSGSEYKKLASFPFIKDAQ